MYILTLFRSLRQDIPKKRVQQGPLTFDPASTLQEDADRHRQAEPQAEDPKV